MRERMERRLARLEVTQVGQGGVHVFRVPRGLEGEALARWRVEAMAGTPKGATVVMVQMRDAGVTP